jgi:hypothetical protein
VRAYGLVFHCLLLAYIKVTFSILGKRIYLEMLLHQTHHAFSVCLENFDSLIRQIFHVALKEPAKPFWQHPFLVHQEVSPTLAFSNHGGFDFYAYLRGWGRG